MIIWDEYAKLCLKRIQQYLKKNDIDSETVEELINKIVNAPDYLLQFPRMGRLIKTSDRKKIRRILVRNYKLFYELRGDEIFILKILHDKEDIEGI